jgi:hypothetical protein
MERMRREILPCSFAVAVRAFLFWFALSPGRQSERESKSI